jgi:catechol 2,3-dioxygenase-like lactoylglutathione lyase family enzyme
MSEPRIEHVNVTVSDPERAARLMESLFGWHVRWQGPARDGGRTIHVGSADNYVALYTGRGVAYTADDFAKGQPLNHIGVQVDDLDAIERKVVAAGLKPFGHDNYDPGRRFYFLDPDGIEYEVVSYR